MSSLDVLYLRKQGRWQEALELALHNINACDFEYSRMALFWVIYDICRMAEKVRGAEDIVEKCIIYMRTLQFDMIDDNGVGRACYNRLLVRHMIAGARVDKAFEITRKQPVKALVCLEGVKMRPCMVHRTFHDCYAWVLCRYLQRQGRKISSNRFRTLLSQYFELQTSRPSKLHSMILDVAVDFVLHRPQEVFNFNRFFDMWGPDNLRWQDRYSFTVFGVSRPPLVPRLLKVLERYTDAEGLSSLTDKIPVWWWARK